MHPTPQQGGLTPGARPERVRHPNLEARMDPSRTRALLATLAVTAIALAGCGGSGDDDEKAATASTPAATATEAAATPEATATEQPASGGGDAKITPLGTKLKVGEPAVIAYEDASNHKKSTIRLTPEKIEKGTLDDFKNIELEGKQKDSTPYYTTIKVENVGKKDLSGASPATYINAVDDRGQDQSEIIFFGTFDRCESETPKSLKPGESYEACLAYLMPGGGSIVGFHWIQFDEKSGKADLNWE
jgi:hypothetical protein